MGFLNVWDPNVTSDGFTGFVQRKFPVRPFLSQFSRHAYNTFTLERDICI